MYIAPLTWFSSTLFGMVDLVDMVHLTYIQVGAGFIFPFLGCRQVLHRDYLCPGGMLWLQFL